MRDYLLGKKFTLLELIFFVVWVDAFLGKTIWYYEALALVGGLFACLIIEVLFGPPDSST